MAKNKKIEQGKIVRVNSGFSRITTLSVGVEYEGSIDNMSMTQYNKLAAQTLRHLANAVEKLKHRTVNLEDIRGVGPLHGLVSLSAAVRQE